MSEWGNERLLLFSRLGRKLVHERKQKGRVEQASANMLKRSERRKVSGSNQVVPFFFGFGDFILAVRSTLN